MAWIGWGVAVGIVFFFLSFSLLALLTWIRLPKATHIPVRGRHLFITGGSSGIGLALAKLAAAEGARISLVARDPRKLAEARESILEYCNQKNEGGDNGVKVNTYSADVKDYVSIEEAIQTACRDSGNLEILILSHGISVPGTFEDTSFETIDNILNTNLKGNINVLKCALPFIKSSTSEPASITMFSSQAGQTGVYGCAVYSASKFALRGLAESLQQELIERNIRISLIFPPDTNTPGYKEEQKTMPELTKKLSESSKLMDAMSVARKALIGMKSGLFTISCNLDGVMLSMVGAGMSPQPSLFLAITEIMGMNLCRIVAFFVLRSWYDTIHSAYRAKQPAKKED